MKYGAYYRGELRACFKYLSEACDFITSQPWDALVDLVDITTCEVLDTWANGTWDIEE